MNDDKNLLGRVIALALILGAVYGVRSIARGGGACPFGGGSRCAMAIPEASVLPAVDEKAAPVEKLDANGDSGEDEDTKLEKKAPVVPPAAPE